MLDEAGMLPLKIAVSVTSPRTSFRLSARTCRTSELVKNASCAKDVVALASSTTAASNRAPFSLKRSISFSLFFTSRLVLALASSTCSRYQSRTS